MQRDGPPQGGATETDTWLTITIDADPLDAAGTGSAAGAAAPASPAPAPPTPEPRVEAPPRPVFDPPATDPPRPRHAPPRPERPGSGRRWMPPRPYGPPPSTQPAARAHGPTADVDGTPASPYDVLDEDVAALEFRRVDPAEPVSLFTPGELPTTTPDGTAEYSTDELDVPTELVDDIEEIAAQVEREVAGTETAPRSWRLRVVESVGWLVVVLGLVVSGSGVGVALEGHFAADRTAEEAGEQLASARAAVGAISGSRSVAVGRIDASTEKVADAQAQLEGLAEELIGLDSVVSDLVLLTNRRGVDFDALLPSLEELGARLDLTVAGLTDIGIPFEASASAQDVFATLATRQAEARAAAAAALEAATTDEGDGDGFGFDTVVLQYPLPGYAVSAVFGVCRDGCSRRHAGIDMTAPMWTPIVATADGTVTDTGWISRGAGYGVIIDHGNGWQSKYFHMATGRLPVRPGDGVKAGDHIGWVGSTGNSAGPHLHFEIEMRGININPMRGFRYVGAVDASISAAMPAVADAPLGGGAVTEMAPTEGDLVLSELLEPLVGDEAHEYVEPEPLVGPIPEVRDELTAARSLIEDREPQDEASALIAGASEAMTAGLEHARQMLVVGAVMLAAGMLLAWGGLWTVRRSRSLAAA